MQDLITGFDYVEQFLSKEHITMNPLFTQDRLVTEYAALYENITL